MMISICRVSHLPYVLYAAADGTPFVAPYDATVRRSHISESRCRRHKVAGTYFGVSSDYFGGMQKNGQICSGHCHAPHYGRQYVRPNAVVECY